MIKQDCALILGNLRQTDLRRHMANYGERVLVFFRLVTIHASDGETDGQTDRILIARRRLYSMQRGKNECLATRLSKVIAWSLPVT